MNTRRLDGKRIMHSENDFRDSAAGCKRESIDAGTAMLKND
jgi:hypothetical protein